MIQPVSSWRGPVSRRAVRVLLACGGGLVLAACQGEQASGEGQVLTSPTGSTATTTSLPVTDTTVVAENTGVAGSAAGGSAATTTAPVNPGQKLIDDGRVIVAKLRSGEKTPQTLTAAERQTLLKLEALRRQHKKRD